MPSLTIAVRTLAKAFSVTTIPLAGGVCVGCSVAVVIRASYEPRASSYERLTHSSSARKSFLLRFGGDGLGSFLLLLPVTNRGANGILGQHRTVDLHRRQRQLLHDVHVLDGEKIGR